MATWQHTDIIIDGQPVKAQAPLLVFPSFTERVFCMDESIQWRKVVCLV